VASLIFAFQVHVRPIFGRLFVKRFAICYVTVVLSLCLSVLSVCNIGVLWPNGWMYQDATWYGRRPRPRRYCIRCRPSSPHGEGHSSPPPSFHVYCGQTVVHLGYCWTLIGYCCCLEHMYFKGYSHFRYSTAQILANSSGVFDVMNLCYGRPM